MTSMIMLVMHDPTLMGDVMNAWTEAGAKGITILASTGYARLKNKTVLRDDLSLFPTIQDLFEPQENENRTLFTLVKDVELEEKIIQATQAVIGDLDQPNTGILVVLPVSRVYGLNRKDRESDENSDR